MFAVSVDGRRDHHRGGLPAAEGGLGPVQQAFQDCHGLQCGFCTPGFVTTVTAYLADHPDPTAEEAREAIGGQPVPVHRLPEHRRPPCSAPPRSSGGRERDHQAVRRPDQAARGPAAGHRGRPLPRRPRPRRATRWRSSAARTRTPGSSTSTSPTALEVDGLVAIYTYEDLDGRMGEPLPLLIPHPTLTHGRTRYAAGARRGQPRRRGRSSWWWPSTGTSPRTSSSRIRVDYEPLPAVVGIDAARAAADLVHPDVPGNVGGAHGAGGRRRRGGDRRRPPRPRARPVHRAQRLHADGGQGRPTPAGTPTTGPCACTPPPRPPPACGWRWRPSSACRWTGSRWSPPTSAAASA